MKIQQKVVLALACFVSLLIIIQANYQYKFYLDDYRKIEENLLDSTATMIKRSISNEVDHLMLLCRDWANWDDSYNYMQGIFPGYEESNLLPETFVMNDTNLMLFIDREGNTKYLGQFFPETSIIKEFSEAQILDFKNLVSFAGGRKEQSGIIHLGPVLMMFARHDILKSDGSGAPAGVIVFGRLLTEERLDVIREQLSVNFAVKIMDLASLKSEVNDDRAEISYGRDKANIAAPLADFLGRNAAAIEFEMPTVVLNQGRKTISESIAFFVISLLLIFFILYFYLVYFFIEPVKLLSAHAGKILVSKDLSERISHFSDDEISRLYESFNTMLDRIAKKEKELTELAVRDGLTGIYNHRHAMNYLAGRIEYFKRYGGVLSVLLFDLDYFKKINDTYGHLTGDEVLKEIAMLISTSVRTTDVVARYGGEEFLVILENQQSEQARYVADKIRKTIELSIIGEKKIRVTASCGISTYSDRKDAEQLIREADTFLYRAKENGRNKTES